MIGQVYGLTSSSAADTTGTQINYVRFTIGLAPGSPTLDISKMKIAFSTPGTLPKIYTANAATTEVTTPSGTEFIAQQDGTGVNRQSLTNQQQIQIAFKTPAAVSKNTVMNMEIRPSVGASLPFSKTTPPAITFMNVLY